MYLVIAGETHRADSVKDADVINLSDIHPDVAQKANCMKGGAMRHDRSRRHSEFFANTDQTFGPGLNRLATTKLGHQLPHLLKHHLSCGSLGSTCDSSTTLGLGVKHVPALFAPIH